MTVEQLAQEGFPAEHALGGRTFLTLAVPRPEEGWMHEPSTERLTGQFARLDPRLSARFRTDGDHVVVASGEIDLATAPKLWEALALLIDRGHREVVVDMAGVEFMDSQGIAAILRAQKCLAPEGGTVVIRAPRDQARKVFEITGLSELIRVED